MTDLREREGLDPRARPPLHAVAGDDDPLGRQEHHGADAADDDEQLLVGLEGWRRGRGVAVA